MSRRAKALSREMHILARQAGGSFKTVQTGSKGIAGAGCSRAGRVEYSGNTIC